MDSIGQRINDPLAYEAADPTPQRQTRSVRGLGPKKDGDGSA